MSRTYVRDGVVFVLVIAVIALGAGLAVRSLLPVAAIAAAPSAIAVNDQGLIIAVVEPDQGGWIVQLDSGDRFRLDHRPLVNGLASPVAGSIQAFADQQCLFGICAGYASLVDAGGTTFYGYRSR